MNSYPTPIPKILIIGYVWPETNASAAGLRDWALLEHFRKAGWQVHYSSPAKPNAFSEKIEKMGVPTFSCEANDPQFDTFVQKLQPDFVLFDRFVTEEQFGWRVQESCPGAVRILDTQDLHCLRRARETALREGWKLERIQSVQLDDCASMIEQFAQEDLLRELSSIYRSDLTLVISSFEMKLLTEHYRIPPELLLLQRFSYDKPSQETLPAFGARKHFVSIGNFRHPPNWDAVQWFAKEIWPEIRTLMPEAEIHIYGAYPSREAMAMNDPARGFLVKGPAESQYETLKQYRVLVAPLRMGAGIKGKISDAWSVGTSVVATPLGAEGMTDGNEDWPGEIALEPKRFAEAACELYSREELWSERQEAGFLALQRYYDTVVNGRKLLDTIQRVYEALPERRSQNLIGAILALNQHRSTKYFSRWIELKQTLKAT